jgi:hypothetical protein
MTVLVALLAVDFVDLSSSSSSSDLGAPSAALEEKATNQAAGAADSAGIPSASTPLAARNLQPADAPAAAEAVPPSQPTPALFGRDDTSQPGETGIARSADVDEDDSNGVPLIRILEGIALLALLVSLVAWVRTGKPGKGA